MLFVPIGYTFGAGMFMMDSVRGGSPYGAGVFAGDGLREPTETELALAEHQGKYMAALVKKLAQTWPLSKHKNIWWFVSYTTFACNLSQYFFSCLFLMVGFFFPWCDAVIFNRLWVWNILFNATIG